MIGRLFSSSVVALFGFMSFAFPAAAQTGDSPSNQASALREAKEFAKRIDQMIEAKWKGTAIKPAARASLTEDYRRLHLDLSGSIPNLLQVRDFIGKQDTSKRDQEIENLLASERYSVHFSYVWRDILLPPKTDTRFFAVQRQFELWLQEKLEANKGYDDVAKELLNNVRSNGRPGSPNAFFVTGGNKPEDLASITARTLLGVKLDCAQCHAHPFAEWTREQFWEMAAFFTQRNNGQQFRLQANIAFQAQPAVPNNPKGFPRPSITIPKTSKVVKATFLDGKAPADFSKLNGPAVLAEWVADKNNPFFAKATVDHVWSYFFGESLLERIEKEESITHPELLNMLAKELADHDFDLKYLIRAIVHTEAYQRSSRSTDGNTEQLALFARMPVRALSPEQLYDSLLVATNTEPDTVQTYAPQLNNFGNVNGTRNQFLLKFIAETKTANPETSILQALFLMNGKFMNKLVDRQFNSSIDILATVPKSNRSRIESLYLMVLSRMPSEGEVQRLLPFIEADGSSSARAQALADVMWALLNSSEFVLNH